MKDVKETINNSKMLRLKVILLNSLLLGFLIILLELTLRGLGFQSGVNGITFSNFAEVDSLIVYRPLVADSIGFTKANKEYNWSTEIVLNNEGFRTNNINTLLSSPRKNRVLLIGDSFAWGLTAKPIFNCFGDLLDQTEYVVYNTGIPGIGPNQYELAAKTYIPIIKPKYVLVTMCMNDLFENLIPLKPYQLPYYKTNAGIISS